MNFEAGMKTHCGTIPVRNLKRCWRRMGRRDDFLGKRELCKVYDFAMRPREGAARLGPPGRGGKPAGIFRCDPLFRRGTETSGLIPDPRMAVFFNDGETSS